MRSLHRHLHKHKRDVDWNDPSNYKDVNWSTVKYGASSTAAAPPAASTSVSPVIVKGNKNANPVTTTPAASSASTPTPSATTSSTAASSAASNPNSNSILHQPSGCPATGFGGRTTPVPGSNVDTYIGNVGSPYGCNMRLVSSADSYDYTNTFQNGGSAPLSIIIWNKAGDPAKGQLANQGQSSAPVLAFLLPAGASQIVAFDANSQVAWSRDCDRNGNGSPDCTWGEGDFGNVSNKGWSGYDVSSIQNSKGNVEDMCITSSPRNAGLESSNRKNNWVKDDQPNQGAGGNIPPEAMPVRLLTVFG